MVMIKGKVNRLERTRMIPPDDIVESLFPLITSPGRTITQPIKVPAWLGPDEDEISLGTLSGARFRIQAPILVKFQTEDQHVIAEAIEFKEFGFGSNRSEALRDLQMAIVELFLTLEKEQDRLGPDLQNVWSHLQDKIHKK